MKLLVTGAKGFIGRHLISHLSQAHEVFAVVRDKHHSFFNERVSVIATDLACALDQSHLPAKIDAIIHLAQSNAVFPEGANELLAVNTGSTQQLLDYGRQAGAKRFILASTGDVYSQRLGACKETDPVEATTFYAVTKQAAEMLVQAYSGYMQTGILRFFNPYGSDQSGRLIPRLAGAIREQKVIRLHKGDRPHLTPMHIDDVIIALERAINSPYSGVVNVAGDRVVNMRELAEEIGGVLGAKPVFEASGEDSNDMAGDNALMKQVFGAWSMVTLTDGLLRTFKREEVPECQAHV